MSVSALSSHLRQRVNEAVNIGRLGCLDDLLVRHLPEVCSIADVVSDAGVKEYGLLTDEPDLRPEPVEIEVFHVMAVHLSEGEKRLTAIT